MNAEIYLNDDRLPVLAITPSNPTERAMLVQFGKLFGLSNDPRDVAWRSEPMPVTSSFQNATWDGTVTSSARKP